MHRLIGTLMLAAAVTNAAGDPAKAGMDAARLAQVGPRLKSYVDTQQMAGAVVLVQRNGVLAQLEALGWQDVEARKPMAADTIFQIMSMTKPVTGVAVMMLVDEGKIRLNDAVERRLPEFRGQWMIAEKSESQMVLKKPARPITIRDLMTHTSGSVSITPPGIAELLPKMDRTLAEAVAIFAQHPLEFEPGTKWKYSNTGIATLGRIVEVASGMPYEKFLETRIFQPLGMKDSHIFLPPEKRGRLAPVYTQKEGKLVKAGDVLLAGDSMKYREGQKYSGPEYALHSTAQDLAALYQMMLDRGVYQGKRLLSAAAVETMTAVHTGDLSPAGWLAGGCFGLTWEVTCRDVGTLTYLSRGTFSHGGAFGTFGWIDPRKKLVGVFLIQWSGNRQDARDAFVDLAGAAVLE